MNYDAMRLSSPLEYEPDEDTESRDEFGAQRGDIEAAEARLETYE